MRSPWVIGVVAGAAMMVPSGCGLLEGESSLLSLLGVIGDRAYFEHYEEWSGFATLPSTIWEVDANTEETRRVATAGVRYDTQLADDYYVAESPTEDDQGSCIVATRMSTGEEIVVLERDIQLGGRYDRVFVVVGGRVVALTEDGVLVYDLAAEQVERTIVVEELLVELLAASDEWALVTRSDVHSGDRLLVNLATDEVVTVPEIPNDHIGLFFDAAFADDYLFTASYSSDGALNTGTAVEALHIPTLTWSTLADYGGSNASILRSAKVYVNGANATHVLVEFIDGLCVARVELIDRATGGRQELDSIQSFLGGAVLHPQLHGDQVYWLRESEQVLVRYDIASGEQETTAVNVPD